MFLKYLPELNILNTWCSGKHIKCVFNIIKYITLKEQYIIKLLTIIPSCSVNANNC